MPPETELIEPEIPPVQETAPEVQEPIGVGDDPARRRAT